MIAGSTFLVHRFNFEIDRQPLGCAPVRSPHRPPAISARSHHASPLPKAARIVPDARQKQAESHQIMRFLHRNRWTGEGPSARPTRGPTYVNQAACRLRRAGERAPRISQESRCKPQHQPPGPQPPPSPDCRSIWGRERASCGSLHCRQVCGTSGPLTAGTADRTPRAPR